MIQVAALYRFASLPDCAALQAPLHALAMTLGLTGTLILAPEGLNGTVAGTPAAIDVFLSELTAAPPFGSRLAGLTLRLSSAAVQPFRRLKVRLKPEIVTFGEPVASTTRTGQFVDAEDWNALLDEPGLLLLDTRNRFEVAMGSFEGAHDPGLDRFTDFRAFAAGLDSTRTPRVAMFCTGGIRCEKASAHLLARGFDEVYQLKGGILAYLDAIPPDESRWTGACFVFDDRVALGPGLTPCPPGADHG